MGTRAVFPEMFQIERFETRFSVDRNHGWPQVRRSPVGLLLAVWGLFGCATQAPPTGQHIEANNLCIERCEEDLGDEELFSCYLLCECAVDALADLYPNEDVAKLLTMLDDGRQESAPEMDQVGRDCALQSSRMPNSGLDPYAAARYSEHLGAAREPRIEPTGREDAEVYRLLVLPSFTSTITVRVERLGDQITYTTKRLSGAGGYEPGEIEWQASGTISDTDWSEFKSLLLAGKYWTRLSYDEMQKIRMEQCNQGEQSACWISFDGTMFVLEGADNARYKVVDRHNSFEEPLQSAVDWLLTISGNKGK